MRERGCGKWAPRGWPAAGARRSPGPSEHARRATPGTRTSGLCRARPRQEGGREAAPLPASRAAQHRLGRPHGGLGSGAGDSGASTGRTLLTRQQQKTQPGSQLQSSMQVGHGPWAREGCRRLGVACGPRPCVRRLLPQAHLWRGTAARKKQLTDEGCCPLLGHRHSVGEARGTQRNKEKMRNLMYIRCEPEGELGQAGHFEILRSARAAFLRSVQRPGRGEGP